MRQQILRLILLALDRADGLPFPERSLIGAVQIAARPADPTESDVLEGLKDAEASRYVQGVTDDVMGRSWSLTEHGKHKARMLR